MVKQWSPLLLYRFHRNFSFASAEVLILFYYSQFSVRPVGLRDGFLSRSLM